MTKPNTNLLRPSPNRNVSSEQRPSVILFVALACSTAWHPLWMATSSLFPLLGWAVERFVELWGRAVSEEEGKKDSCSASSKAAPTSSSLASKGVSSAPRAVVGRGPGFRLHFRLRLCMGESLSPTLLVRLVDHVLVCIQILGSAENSSSRATPIR
jgi:hypothetical protein